MFKYQWVKAVSEGNIEYIKKRGKETKIICSQSAVSKETGKDGISSTV